MPRKEPKKQTTTKQTKSPNAPKMPVGQNKRNQKLGPLQVAPVRLKEVERNLHYMTLKQKKTATPLQTSPNHPNPTHSFLASFVHLGHAKTPQIHRPLPQPRPCVRPQRWELPKSSPWGSISSLRRHLSPCLDSHKMSLGPEVRRW